MSGAWTRTGASLPGRETTHSTSPRAGATGGGATATGGGATATGRTTAARGARTTPERDGKAGRTSASTGAAAGLAGGAEAREVTIRRVPGTTDGVVGDESAAPAGETLVALPGATDARIVESGGSVRGGSERTIRCRPSRWRTGWSSCSISSVPEERKKSRSTRGERNGTSEVGRGRGSAKPTPQPDGRCAFSSVRVGRRTT